MLWKSGLYILIEPVFLENFLLLFLFKLVLRRNTLRNFSILMQIKHICIFLIPYHLETIDERVNFLEEVTKATSFLNFLASCNL